jgi:multiple sugar transport system ATP-binding protein
VTGARLSLRGLRVRFGAVAALNGLSLEVEPGEFMVLLGPSGCGKSTLLAAIAGLQALDSGQVVLDGRDVTRLEPADRDTAIVFQSYALYPTMTVSQNITFGMRMRGVPRAERARRLADIGRLLQLEPLLARRPSQLSGGQQQRVAIGRALVRDPKLFLLDEPLSSLDAPLRLEMRAQIKQLHGRLGTTVVYVTHDQVEAMGMATRIALMHEGSVVQVGEPQDVYDRPATLFAARFVGSPRMNLIPGRLAVHDGSVVAEVGGMILPLASYAWSEAPEPRRRVILGIRPEHVRCGSVAWPIGSCAPSQIERTGPDLLLTLPFAGTEITARVDRAAALAVGQPAPFALDLHHVSVFCAEAGHRL